MLKVVINTKPISLAEINQLRKENELLSKEVVYFLMKYMETRELLQEGLELLDCIEERLQETEDNLFWLDEVVRLYKEGCEYKDALEIVKLSKKIRDIYRRKDNKHCKLVEKLEIKGGN